MLARSRPATATSHSEPGWLGVGGGRTPATAGEDGQAAAGVTWRSPPVRPDPGPHAGAARRPRAASWQHKCSCHMPRPFDSSDCMTVWVNPFSGSTLRSPPNAAPSSSRYGVTSLSRNPKPVSVVRSFPQPKSDRSGRYLNRNGRNRRRRAQKQPDCARTALVCSCQAPQLPQLPQLPLVSRVSSACGGSCSWCHRHILGKGLGTALSV